MKVAVFDTHRYDRDALAKANSANRHELRFLETRLSRDTVELARGCEAVCCFVNDRVDADVLNGLAAAGVKFIALRSAGFNHVDIKAAEKNGMIVARVPEYSPHAVAEHAIALMMAFNRKIHRAHNRIHELNFSLDGLVGFDLYGKTVGVAGTGKIGRIFAEIMKGFGCKILAYDQSPNAEWAEKSGIRYVDRSTLFHESDILSLHMPLTPETKHFICAEAFSQMKKETIIINTGRGGLIDSNALIQALKTHAIGGACLDVYEEEEGIFFSDLSEVGLVDDCLARLLTFPNVLITSHQAFLTNEALKNIAETTIANLNDFASGSDLNERRVVAKS